MEPNSSIFTEAEADDYLAFDISNDPPVNQSFGTGNDLVEVSGDALSQVRLAFTSSEVGNGSDVDSGNLANQNGSLAVRMRAEAINGQVTGTTSKFDDEGINFIANGGFTFDVRDIPTGISRGDQFSIVRLGTMAADLYDEGTSALATYINAGMGADTVTGGTGNDFLVGGAGDDVLSGSAGNDSFIGGGGADQIFGGTGDDVAIYNISSDGADRMNLGDGLDDRVVVSSSAGAGQVRLAFTSSEVGNANASDAGTMMNQDGGLAVRVQAEGADGTTGGEIARADDEGVAFVAGTAGLTFDVRDLVSGAARGDQFGAVFLGTSAVDTYDLTAIDRPVYVNAGMGDDSVTGGNFNDFLVGGAGNDRLLGGGGNDSFIGGAGDDAISGGDGNDTIIYNISNDGVDRVNSGTGIDIAQIATASGTTQVRLTFTSAEVGNDNASDAGTLTNQDGALAVRAQAEDAQGGLTSSVARFDDEGISFVAASANLTFDVRDLVSGTERGDQFGAVFLGTAATDVYDVSLTDRPVYINAGGGNDVVTGGQFNDFLVGGAGDDILEGGAGDDSVLGGGGVDIFVFDDENTTIIDGVLGSDGPGDDTIVDFVSGTDKIDLSAFELSDGDVTSSTVDGNTVLSIDTSGDGMGDFTITLNGVTTAPVMTDYIL